jgi:hypothetical protein
MDMILSEIREVAKLFPDARWFDGENELSTVADVAYLMWLIKDKLA